MSSNLVRTPLPYLALVTTHLIWGANFVIAKITLNEFPVMSLAFARFFLAIILLLPFLLTLDKKQRSIKLKHLFLIFSVGLLMVTFNIALFYEGLLRTEAITASVLTLIIPILSVLGSWLFLKEKIYSVNFLGILIGFLGTLIILGLPILFVGSLKTNTLIGNLLIVLSSVSFVAGSILSKRIIHIYHPLIVPASLFLTGAATFFIPALLEYLKDPTWISHVSILGILGLIYISVFSSVVAYFLLSWGLSKIEVVQANLFSYMEPAVASTFAVLLLGERISYSFILGTCLVVLGVYWGTLGKNYHHHLHHRSHRI